MSWTVAIVVLCGGLAGLAARLLVRDVRANRSKYTFFFVVTFLILLAVTQGLVLPSIRASQARTKTRADIANDRVFSLLAKQHPEFEEQFTELVVGLARDGASPESVGEQVGSFSRSTVAGYFARYAGLASPEALARYISAMVDTLDHLRRTDPEGCYEFLYGAGSGAMRRPLPRGYSERLSSSMADAIETALRDPQAQPDAADSERLLRELTQRLALTHDEEFMKTVAELAHAKTSTADRGALCTATVEMFREISRTSEPDRSLLVRRLVGNDTSEPAPVP